MGLLAIFGAAVAGLVGYLVMSRREDAGDGADTGAGARVLPPGSAPGTPVVPAPTENRARARDHDRVDDSSADQVSHAIHRLTTADWAPHLAGPCLIAGISLPYALKWIGMESGGNPCSIGYPPAHGKKRSPADRSAPWPNQPLELGIAQFYNPDDLQVLGLDANQLRAYCVPGDQHLVRFGTKMVTGFSQDQSRDLTPQEMTDQAQGAAALIARSRAKATRDLAAVGASWPETGRDFWKLVKLQHGLPGLSREGLPAVKKILGRAPRGWAELRDGLVRVRLSPVVEADRADFARVLANAEDCASVMPDDARAVDQARPVS